MVEDPRRWLVDKLGDIANVEINTMVAEISARKPPPWPDALHEICETYVDYLRRNGKTEILQSLPSAIDVSTKPVETFAALRECAQREIGHPGTIRQASDDAKQIVFFRIRESCKQIQSIVEKIVKDSGDFKDLHDNHSKLETNERIKIRKIWELGTNRVVLQTVMQLDGDVISRVSANRVQQDDLLLRLHDTSLSQSITYWNMVLTLIAQFARGSFGRLFGRP